MWSNQTLLGIMNIVFRIYSLLFWRESCAHPELYRSINNCHFLCNLEVDSLVMLRMACTALRTVRMLEELNFARRTEHSPNMNVVKNIDPVNKLVRWQQYCRQQLMAWLAKFSRNLTSNATSLETYFIRFKLVLDLVMHFDWLSLTAGQTFYVYFML